MLTKERQAIILEIVNKEGSVTQARLCEILEASESTIRRDLEQLDKEGLLEKVRGGAVSTESNSLYERNVEEKEILYNEEKTKIAKCAAGLIQEGDLVYLDAGTTTERMIDFITCKDVVFVTNAFVLARKLALRGFKVCIPAGEIKIATEAIVGAECVVSIQHYNFNKCFMGTNGVSVNGGYTTPDRVEAIVKTAAVNKSRKAYVLADHSKFDKVLAVTFAGLNDCTLITDKYPSNMIMSETDVIVAEE